MGLEPAYCGLWTIGERVYQLAVQIYQGRFPSAPDWCQRSKQMNVHEEFCLGQVINNRDFTTLDDNQLTHILGNGGFDSSHEYQPDISRGLQMLKDPNSQIQGLSLLVKSLQENQNDLQQGRQWMREWIKNGVLEYLVDMSTQIDVKKDESTMRLLCTASLALLQACTEHSQDICNFLNTLIQTIQNQPKGAVSLATYWLLLAALDLQVVRKASTRIKLMDVLQARLRDLSLLQIDFSCLNGRQYMDEYLDKASATQSCRQQSRNDTHSSHHQPQVSDLHGCPIPHLDLNWLGSWWEGGANASCMGVQYNSTPGSKAGQAEEENLRSRLAPPCSQESFTRLEFSPSQHFSDDQRGPESSSHNNDEPPLELLRNRHKSAEAQHCFSSAFVFGDPRSSWGLPKGILPAELNDPDNLVLAEKIALLEACLVLSALGELGAASLDLCHTIIEEFCHMAELNKLERTLVRFGGSLMGEIHTAAASIHICGDGALARIEPNISGTKVPVDYFISFVKGKLGKAMEACKEGGGAFAQVTPLLRILRIYVTETRSHEPAKSLILLMDSALNSLEQSFVIHEDFKVGQWTRGLLDTFPNLLKLYIVILKRVGHTIVARNMVMRLMKDKVFLQLLKEYAMWLMSQSSRKDTTHKEKIAWQLTVWTFLKIVAESVKWQVLGMMPDADQNGEDTQNGNMGYGCTSGTKFAIDLMQWEFLLKPRKGLASIALGNRKWENSSKGFHWSLHSQVAGFLKACMAIPENMLLQERGFVEFYTCLHYHRFRTIYEDNGPETTAAEWKLCNLHLEVLLEILKHRHGSWTTTVHEAHLADFLIKEVAHEAQKALQIPGRSMQYSSVGKIPEIGDPLNTHTLLRSVSSEVEEFAATLGETFYLSCRNQWNSGSYNIDANNVIEEEADHDGMSLWEMEKIIMNNNSGTKGFTYTAPGRKSGHRVQRDVSIISDESFNLEKIPDMMLHRNVSSSMQSLTGSSNAACCGSPNSNSPASHHMSDSALNEDWGQCWSSKHAEAISESEDCVSDGCETEFSSSVSCSFQSIDSDSHVGEEDITPQPSTRPLCIPKLALNQADHEGISSTEPQAHDVDMLGAGNTANSENAKIWIDADTHITIIRVLLEYLLLVDCVEGSPRDAQDRLAQLGNLSTALLHHINHPKFAPLKQRLKEVVKEDGKPTSLLLRMFLKSEFNVSWYKPFDRVHHGERAQVQRCHIIPSGNNIPKTCIIKALDFPVDHTLHSCILDVFAEICVLDAMGSNQEFCELYDFGVSEDSIYVVMKNYPCSLLDWRAKLPLSDPWAIRLLLQVFRSLLTVVGKLHCRSIVHFDLKCSNVLLEPLEGMDSMQAAFWIPQSEHPNFSVVLSDFGEARCCYGKEAAVTMIHRGTEVCQAPEMLQMKMKNGGNRDQIEGGNGAGFPCDIWALGCLLFELITGKILYFEQDFLRFYSRITDNNLPIIEEQKAKLLHESYREDIIDLLEFILIRDQTCRPSIPTIIKQVDRLLDNSTLPQYQPPPDISTPEYSSPEMLPSSDAQDFLSSITLPPGLTDITPTVAVFAGHDLSRLLDPNFLSDHAIGKVFLLKSGQSCGGEGDLIGACSRMKIDGVTLVNWNLFSGVKDFTAQHDLIDLMHRGVGEFRKVVVCGEGPGLVELTVMVLGVLEGMSEFEALLTLKRDSRRE